MGRASLLAGEDDYFECDLPHDCDANETHSGKPDTDRCFVQRITWTVPR